MHLQMTKLGASHTRYARAASAKGSARATRRRIINKPIKIINYSKRCRIQHLHQFLPSICNDLKEAVVMDSGVGCVHPPRMTHYTDAVNTKQPFPRDAADLSDPSPSALSEAVYLQTRAQLVIYNKGCNVAIVISAPFYQSEVRPST